MKKLGEWTTTSRSDRQQEMKLNTKSKGTSVILTAKILDSNLKDPRILFFQNKTCWVIQPPIIIIYKSPYCWNIHKHKHPSPYCIVFVWQQLIDIWLFLPSYPSINKKSNHCHLPLADRLSKILTTKREVFFFLPSSVKFSQRAKTKH